MSSFTGPSNKLVLPPGWTAHRADGQQIEVAKIQGYTEQGQIVELRKNGKRIGQVRPPTIIEVLDYLGGDGRN